MDIKNKIAIVTGASDGLGKQVALKLAKEGVSLALLARNRGRLDEVSQEAERLGSPKVCGYVCDIQDKEQIKKTVQQIEVDFNEVQILLNIAGICQKLNLLENIDIGNYFFAGHPRERVGVEERQKFFFFEFILFLIGLTSPNLKKYGRFLIIYSLIALLAVFIFRWRTFEQTLPLAVPLIVVIALGLEKTYQWLQR